MKRLLAIAALAAALAGPVRADDLSDRIVDALEAQGFSILELHRTWLGRIRVVAAEGDLRREMVFHPGTGEILRDYVFYAIADSGDGSALRPGRRDDDRDTAIMAGTAAESDVADDMRMDAETVLVPEAVVVQPHD